MRCENRRSKWCAANEEGRMGAGARSGRGLPLIGFLPFRGRQPPGEEQEQPSTIHHRWLD